MIANRETWCVTSCLATLIAASASVVSAQTHIEPGFNLFSVQQDQDIGRQSADEAERQLPILRDRSIQAYVDGIGKRLAAVAPGANYPYQFKIVNVADINAFALPGGYLYVNRGLIEATQNEGQLAGVMAHEMAHVALRHGTNQASKAYLGQAGLGLLGGLVGKNDASTQQTIASVGGFGLNTLFLKYSRTAEEQADVTGAQMMAKAGYDPADMVAFFDILARTQARDPSKVEQFFSSHPAPANRSARINQEITMLTVRPIKPVGGFAQVKAELARMSPAASMQQVAQGQAPPSSTRPTAGGDRSVADIRVDEPSTQFRMFSQRDGLYQIEYPSNWRVFAADQGYGVTIAPDGGFADTGRKERDLVLGVIVNHYDPFENDSNDRFGDGTGLIAGSTNLSRATSDLVEQILQLNPNLRLIRDSERRSNIDGAPSLSVVLSGRSPVTRQEERITVFTRGIPDDHVIYALFIAPQRDYDRLNETFNRMISSVRVSDERTHSSSSEQVIGSSLSGANRSVSGSNAASVPVGTAFMVSFQQALSSADSRSGDRFTARVVDPVLVNGRVAIAAGSVVSGRVVAVQPAKKIGGRAQLNLEFTSIRFASGGESPISASLNGQADSQKDAVTIGAAAAGGAVLGRILGKDSHSTVLGAVIGGAIGTGIAARKKGEEVNLPEGVAVEIRLDAPFDF
jgi:Zn-dependent protease with chaperone function